MSAASLQTVLRNISGGERTFTCLPPHGKTLAAGEEITLDGDLGTILASLRSPRKVKAFQALLGTKLAIVKTPSPHYYDETLDITKVLKVDNNAVSATDPSWGHYSSSIGG